mmetsp:Transcript_24622/g.68883  ORF Transcript_24622/g.68883 Transcript_24622/m.68883 type:complete len:478 (+) Transcript_24622:59-1492(+)
MGPRRGNQFCLLRILRAAPRAVRSSATHHDARPHPLRGRLRTRQCHRSGRLLSPCLHSNCRQGRQAAAVRLLRAAPRGAGRPEDERPRRRAGRGGLARLLHVPRRRPRAHRAVHEEADPTDDEALRDDEHRDEPVPPADPAALLRSRAVPGGRAALWQEVHVQRAYGPVGLLELLWVEGHELLARHLLREPGAVPGERAASPVAAERQVEHHVHAREMLLRAVQVEPEERVRRAPGVRLRGTLLDVVRLLAPWPEPGPEVAVLRRPLRGVRAAALLVEARTYGIDRAFLDATLVVELAGGVDVAVGGRGARRAGRPPAGHVLARHHLGLVAPVRGVQRGGRSHLDVDSLDDVVLAQGWPRVVGVLPKHPEGRPRAAARGHVVDADDEEPRVVRVLGPHAHGPAAGASSARRHLCAHVHPVARGVGQARRQRGRAVYVDDVPAGGVGRTVKVPLVEEVGPHVGAVFQVPASNRHSSLG